MNIKNMCIRFWRGAMLMLLFILLATAVGYLFSWAGFPETNIVLLYLGSVLLTARYTHGYVYGIIASVIATFAFNYFFTVPKFTLAVNDTSYIITFVIMTSTALATSMLTGRMKRSARQANEREQDMRALYQLTNRLTEAANPDAIAQAAVEAVSESFACNAAFLRFEPTGAPERIFLQRTGSGITRKKLSDDDNIARRVQYTRASHASHIEGDIFSDWPIYGRQNVLGVIRLPIERASQLSSAQAGLLRAMADSVAMAMDRLNAAQEQQHYREENQRERYRSNLLRAISHDLRTPLSGIMGASEMIRAMSGKDDERYKLALGIWKDADWLHALVENILSLTRLEDGTTPIRKQPEAVEEVVGSVLEQMARRAPDRNIMLDMPDDLIMVPMDARLIVQVLINLLSNAIEHTPSGAEIELRIRVEENLAVFAVLDRGEGIAQSDLPHIFERFYTTRRRSSDAVRNMGLGLSICDTIVRAHGGSIHAENRIGGGAAFIFTIPLEERQ